MIWNLYHLDNAHAKNAGDPVLGEVEAPTREDAINKGTTMELVAPTGIWAVPKEWAFLRREAMEKV